MKINKTTDGSKLTIALEGRLDSATSPELENELKESMPGIQELHFDFSELE